jgi:hypothetical protein
MSTAIDEQYGSTITEKILARAMTPWLKKR